MTANITLAATASSFRLFLLLLVLLDPLVYGFRNCYNNGTLIYKGTKTTCVCHHPFTGKYCEDYACVNGLSTGSQYDPNHLFFNKRCLCDPGWTGELCTKSLINRCGEHGSDIDGHCKCKKYFVGDRCQYVTKCFNGQLYNGRCWCHYGWAGVFCDFIICHHGYRDISNKKCICPPNYRGKYCDFCAESSKSLPECAEIENQIFPIDGDNAPIISAVIITIGLVVSGALLYILCYRLSNNKKAKVKTRQSEADIEIGPPNSACENRPLSDGVQTQFIDTGLTVEARKFYNFPPPPYETLTPLQKEQNESQHAANKTIAEANSTVAVDFTDEKKVDRLETAGKNVQQIKESAISADQTEQLESSNVENGISIEQERSVNQIEQSKQHQSNAERVENNQTKKEFHMNENDHLLRQQTFTIQRNVVDLRTLISLDPTEIDEIRFSELPKKTKKIGKGATSTVYLFKMPDESLIAGKKIDINLFHRSSEDKEQIQKQINLALNEIKILKKVNHQNIVEVFGCFWDESKMILFMELMPMSLKEMICENILSEAECVNYSIQTASGLSYLHHLKPKAVVHRDIKCGNLLLNEKGVVKLADFGLSLYLALNSASQTRRSEAPRSLAGTHHFMAPEVLWDRENLEAYGRKSDIWCKILSARSFGCTIVEMLSGYPPFYGLGQTKYIQHANTEPHWRQYKGELLLPKATDAMQKLLNCLFTVDQRARPPIDIVLKVLHGMEQNSFGSLIELHDTLFPAQTYISP